MGADAVKRLSEMKNSLRQFVAIDHIERQYYPPASWKGISYITIRHIKAVIVGADMLAVLVVDIDPILQYSSRRSTKLGILKDTRDREIKDWCTE